MPDAGYESSAYSLHFNKLKLMGAWVVDPGNALVLNLYHFYKTVMTVVASCGCLSLFFDLYLVFGDFKKVTWNLCISTLFSASLLKNIITIHYSSVINRLRSRLHRDFRGRSGPEDVALEKRSLRELRCLQLFFYGLAGVLVPTWLVTFYFGYFWSPKDMPIPLRLPIEIDTDNRLQYNIAFGAIGIGGLMGINMVLENELAMFAILIQISREYKRLLGDIPKLNELYAEKRCGQEMNSSLRIQKTKSLVKEYSTRQQKLIEYTEDFELSYTITLLLQVFAMSVLIVVSAMQCILEFGNLTMNVSYQLGYLFIIATDMFLVCWFATRIRGMCLRVGEEAYSTVWYQMAPDIRRDLCMMIMRSQRPPKITSGKVMEMNLHAFMLVSNQRLEAVAITLEECILWLLQTMRSIYSWLALFQQLALKE